MKQIFVMMCLVVFSAVVTAEEIIVAEEEVTEEDAFTEEEETSAEEAADESFWDQIEKIEEEYEAFLERDPNYVKVKNEWKEKEAKHNSLYGIDFGSKEYYRAYLESQIKYNEKCMLKYQLCIAAEDPADIAIIKEYSLSQLRIQSRFINELPKKDIPGSPEFQYAMYVIDEIKEGRVKETKGPPYMGAFRLLECNLKKVAFDDPEWRKKEHERMYVFCAYEKRSLESNIENMDLYIKVVAAISNLTHQRSLSDPELNSDPAWQKYQQLSEELAEAKKKTDPLYEKLINESMLFERQEQTLEEFAQKNSHLQEAKEYLEYLRVLRKEMNYEL